MQLHQQKGMISLSPPTICNSAPPHGRLTHAASLDPLGHGAGHPACAAGKPG
nr:hypothetical protein [Escherichia coli]